MKAHRTVVLGVSLIAGFTLGVKPAEACSAAACVQGYAAPSAGAVVPANTPAFFVRASRGAGSTLNAPFVELRTSLGTKIDATISADPANPDGWLVAPSAPLSADTDYSLVSGIGCTFTADAAAPEETAAFRTAGPSTLPDSIGTLVASEGTIGATSVPVSTGECSREAKASKATAKLTLSDGMTRFRDVVKITAYLDGQPWEPRYAVNQFELSPRYGKLPKDGVIELHRLCPTEAHTGTLEVRAHVAGAASDPPPISTTVSFPACEAGPPLEPLTNMPAEVEPTASDGCSMATAPARSALPSLLGLAVAFVIGRAARRRVRTPR